MEEVSIIGIDLVKRSFQVHRARADGSVAYRRKLSRGKLLSFLASQPPCTVAMADAVRTNHLHLVQTISPWPSTRFCGTPGQP